MPMLELYEQFYQCKGFDFVVTPEGGYLDSLQKSAKEKVTNYIGGFLEKGSWSSVGVTLVNSKGEIVDRRYKAVYPGFVDRTYSKRGTVRPFIFNNITILPIVCYEIIFPRLWMKKEFKPDFITHHVGFDMFDVFQLEGWKALQESMAKFFNCDVICSCGGDTRSPMNLSGITKPNDTIYDYTPLYKEYRGEH